MASRPASIPAVALLLALAAAPACSRGVPRDQLSVVLVTLDTTRADRIGAFGGSGGLSPEIDRVAREGVVFEEAISQVPLTLPAHASMMTGRYPATHGVRHNGIYRLRESEATLAERLAEHGFETAGFVASYVLNAGFGVEQGFQVYNDVPGDRFAGGEDRIYTATRSADEVNKQVFSWLDARQDPGKRFFLWVHYYDPHDPWQAPEKPGARLVGEGYDREISYMDACFGDLVRRLGEAGVLDRSILVVAGDHGEGLGDHGEMQHGIFLYEEIVRVPLLIRAPGHVPAGKRVAGPVELVDLAPTILGMLGLPPLAEAQGRSLGGRIDGRDDGRDAVAHAESLMSRLEYGWSEVRMIRDGRFKYVQAPRPEMYDLDADPVEKVDLAANDAARASAMAGRLEGWVEATTDLDAARQAARKIDPDEEARLRALGYLGGDFFKSDSGGGASLTDPKDGIRELRDLAVAREKLRNGNPAGALIDVDRLLAANPLNHVGRWTKIIALIELGRFKEAEQEALAALAGAEEDENLSGVLGNTARDLLAKALRLEGRYSEAEAQYRQILQAEPGNRIAAVDLARLLLEVGRTGDARRVIEPILADDPKDGKALNALFLIQRRDGDLDGAVRTARLMAEVRTGDPPVLAGAARILADRGHAAEAAVLFELALTQLRDLDGALLADLGAARLAAGNPKGAEEALRAAQSLRPNDPRPHYLLGTIALWRGDESAGRALLDEALRLNPRLSASRVALGRWLASRGRSDEAARAFEDALARNPEDERAADLLRKLRSGEPLR